MIKFVYKEYLERDIAKVKFLKKLEEFGYILRLKPIKHIYSHNGSVRVKANCDVDLTLDMVRMKNEFRNFLLFSGDGDFEILVQYFKEMGYGFKVVGNSVNTAIKIKTKYSNNFIDFSTMKEAMDKNEGNTFLMGPSRSCILFYNIQH